MWKLTISFCKMLNDSARIATGSNSTSMQVCWFGLPSVLRDWFDGIYIFNATPERLSAACRWKQEPPAREAAAFSMRPTCFQSFGRCLTLPSNSKRQEMDVCRSVSGRRQGAFPRPETGREFPVPDAALSTPVSGLGLGGGRRWIACSRPTAAQAEGAQIPL